MGGKGRTAATSGSDSESETEASGGGGADTTTEVFRWMREIRLEKYYASFEGEGLEFMAGLLTQGVPGPTGVPGVHKGSWTGPLDTPPRIPWALSR